MYRFECDYTEGCIPEILEAISRENHTQLQGYSEDTVSLRVKAQIKALCGRTDADVHFLVGGTQANTTVISAALRPHQGVISADKGHIACHETGAIEATGHKVIALPSDTGRLTARQIREHCAAHYADASFEHIPQPGMVYISHPAENGSLYTLNELKEIRKACDEYGLFLFLDGARLGYGLMSPATDVTLQDIARLTDVFYIGGTKVGALFGEAVVVSHPALKKDFRYLIKRHGGMLAKGWLLALQFEELFKEDRYFKIAKKAVEQAMRIKEAFAKKGCAFLMDSYTNQQFPILTKSQMAKFSETYAYSVWEPMDEERTAVRFATSWATTDEQVAQLVADIDKFL